MRIAVTYENGEIFQHFGHTEQFKLYDVENGRIVNAQIVDSNGSGHGLLAGFLKEVQTDALICGGIGVGAQMALAEAGIRLYVACRARRTKRRRHWRRDGSTTIPTPAATITSITAATAATIIARSITAGGN